jgi:hypothetical protein
MAAGIGNDAGGVFEVVKTGVLPLITLVIGFYFPNNR